MKRVRQGATLPQVIEDVNRNMGLLDQHSVAPQVGLLNEGELIILKGQGKIMWRDQGVTYTVTGTPT